MVQKQEEKYLFCCPGEQWARGVHPQQEAGSVRAEYGRVPGHQDCQAQQGLPFQDRDQGGADGERLPEKSLTEPG